MHEDENRKKAGSKQVRGTALFVLLLLFSLPLITPADSVGGDLSVNDYLYLIEDQAGTGTAALKGLSVELYQRIPPYYLISAPFESRRAIEEKGFVFYEIGALERGNSLFLLTRPADRQLGDRPTAGQVLFRGDNWFLVKGDQDNVPIFGREGFEITYLPLRSLPLENPKKGGVLRTGRVYLSPEAREKAANSDSTITRYLQRLENFQTRYSYTDSVIASAEWIYDKFIEFGFTDVAYDSFMASGRWQRNVVATKLGSVNPDQVIVIGGHYDSVTYDSNCDPMEWAPGVDDDGSGTALTLDIARILAGEDVEITLKFVPFAAEEQGLYGSWHFAEEAYNSGMDIRVMFNMDMVGNLDDLVLDVDLNTDSQSRSYAELMEQVALDSTSLIPRITNSGGGSDHYPFQQYGFNHVYVEEGDFSPHWHRCTDTVENVDISYLVDVENMVLSTIILVANAPAIPTGLAAQDLGDGENIRLEWDAGSEPDLYGYRIFWGPEPEVYDHVDTSLVNSFMLENLTPEESLYVAITALDNDGYESIQTDPLGTIPLERPRAPEGFESTSYSDRVALSWEPNSELDIAGYTIMQGTRGGWDFYQIASLPATETSFIDSTYVVPGIYFIYYVLAIDSTGLLSNDSEPAFGRLATHDRGILVIDATRDGTGGPFAPTDEAVDLFYEDLLQDFNLMAQWDYAESIAVDRRPVDADMAIYSTVVFHRDDRFGEDQAPDTLNFEKFLDTGGNLLVGGWSTLTNLSGGQDTFLPGSFFYDHLKISSYITSAASDMDFVGARGASGDYNDVSIDDEKVMFGGLFSLNVFDADPVAGSEVYTYISADSAGSQYHGEGMGVEYTGQDFGVAVLNFPLFYMNSLEAADLMATAMTSFGEGPSIVGDGGPAGDQGLPKTFSLDQNYPNPFNPSTTISFAIPSGVELVPTRVTIYDIRGRMVKRIIDDKKAPGFYNVHWNGKNERGVTVSSGVYIYTITAGDYRSSRKMVVVR